MADFTNFAESKILNLLLQNHEDYYWHPECWIALFTSDPGETGSGSEVSDSGTGYARVITTDKFEVSASGDPANNTVLIEFPEATGAWGTVTHIGLMDAETGGNCLMYAALGVAKPVTTGDTVRIAINAMEVSVD